MPGLDAFHTPAPPAPPEPSNTGLGLVLFAFYLLLYAIFVVLNAFWPAALDRELAGVNLGLVYGLTLIGTAFVLALVYALLCRVAPRRASEKGASR